MKRCLSAILAALLFVSMAGCGTETVKTPEETSPVQTEATSGVYTWDFTVPGAMAYPVYSFEGTPTTDEVRQMAVKAMRDQLSVRWGVDRYYRYNKTAGSITSKDFSNVPLNVYAGVPYTNGSATIFHWFEYYDPQTGILSLPGDPQNMNTLVGNSCAASVAAAWIAVCQSVGRVVPTFYMVPDYGFMPVGDYVYPAYVKSYKDYPTDRIIADNTEEVMMASYAQILPADALISNPDNHAIMAIEPAHVVYDEDGNIDPKQSYVAIQDQRGGSGDSYYVVEEEDVTCYYSGRTYHEYTFRQLYDLGYIPLTNAEFMGIKEYTAPEATFSMETYTAENVHQGTITSNFHMIVVRAVLIDDQGQRQTLERHVMTYSEMCGTISKCFDLGYIQTRPTSDSVQELLEEGRTYTFVYEVTMSNGEIIPVASVELTK